MGSLLQFLCTSRCWFSASDSFLFTRLCDTSKWLS